MNNPLETTLFDRAARLAIDAHSGTERRAKGFPYIIHPMEAAAIVSTITRDQELLAAAVLHDVVEDTDVTVEQIRNLFGDRVATLVQHETAPDDKNLSWRQKKQIQLDQLAMADRDSKIVAIGDKLSNIRGITNDYRLVGDKVWTRFHAPGGKKDIEWYYRGIATALFELSETLPFQEFLTLLDQTFGPMEYDEAQRVDLNDYEESGGGYMATSYNHRNGQTMVKFYNADIDRAVPQNELQRAYSVFLMRVPTPMPGRFITDGSRFGAEFRRINPKESFARYVSNRPESYEEIGIRFARMCLDLHNTPCNTALFPSQKRIALQDISASKRFNESEKVRIREFFSNVADRTTCLHGDMHIGNVITTALEPAASPTSIQQDFWIDMGDFGWGHPDFDLGMFYLTTNVSDDAMAQHLFHIDLNTLRRIWNVFVRHYYSIDSDDRQREIEQSLRPFAALKMIHFDLFKPMPEPMLGFVRQTLLDL